MNRLIIFSFIFIVTFVVTPRVFAQENNASLDQPVIIDKFEIPAPIKDLLNTFRSVNEGVKKLPVVQKATQEIQKCLTTTNNDGTSLCIEGQIRKAPRFLQSLSDIWDSANRWLQSTIGVSVGEILRTIGNFVVWALKWFAEFLQSILSRL